LIPRWSKSDKEHQRNNNKNMTFSAKIVGIWWPYVHRWYLLVLLYCFMDTNKLVMVPILFQNGHQMPTIFAEKKQYNKTRRYHLCTFQVLCNYLVYFLRSNQLYTCITIFYLQDFNMFDGDTKTTTSKLPQHPFSYPIKLYFQGWEWL
jgi:hypothetical protein